MVDISAEVTAILRAREDEKWFEQRDRIAKLVIDAAQAEGARGYNRGYFDGFVDALTELARDPEPEPPPRDFYAGDALAQPDGHP